MKSCLNPGNEFLLSMRREGIFLSEEQKVRKELTELSLQKQAELNPREEESWPQRTFQSESIAQAKA